MELELDDHEYMFQYSFKD